MQFVEHSIYVFYHSCIDGVRIFPAECPSFAILRDALVQVHVAPRYEVRSGVSVIVPLSSIMDTRQTGTNTGHMTSAWQCQTDTQ